MVLLYLLVFDGWDEVLLVAGGARNASHVAA